MTTRAFPTIDRRRRPVAVRFAVRFLAPVVALTLVLAIAGCGGSSGAGRSTTADAPSGSLTVSAAASLTEAFGAEASAFRTAHPGVRVSNNFGSSSTLATQIVNGAPVDVFASADTATMTKVADAGLLAGPSVVFATNSLQIIVPKGNPRNIRGLADLATTGLVYVTCSTDVPIGKYAAQALQKAGVTVTPRSLEPDVKGIVAKVVAGEADAGIVYATDVAATKGAATGVDIPASANVTATYPIAVVEGAANPTAARAWIDFLLAPAGQEILRAHGFGTP